MYFNILTKTITYHYLTNLYYTVFFGYYFFDSLDILRNNIRELKVKIMACRNI